MHNAPNERCGTAPLFHMPSYIYNKSHDHWNLWSGATSCPSSRLIQVPSSNHWPLLKARSGSHMHNMCRQVHILRKWAQRWLLYVLE
jgi:hypothetical protein